METRCAGTARGVRPRDGRRGSPRGRAPPPHARTGRRPATACARSTPTRRTTCAGRGSPSAHFPRTILFDPLMNFPAGGVAIWPPLFDLALAAPARLAHGADAPAGRGRAGRGVGARRPRGRRRSCSRACSRGGSTAARPAPPPRSFSRSAPGTSSGRSTRTPTSTWPSRSAACSRSGSSSRAARSRTLPGNAAARGRRGRRARARGPDLAGRDLLGRDLRARARSARPSRTRRSTLRAAVWTLGLPAAVAGAATAAWLGWLSPPLTYVSFGFFQPLFLAALCGGTAALDLAARAAARGRRRAARSPARSPSWRSRPPPRCPSRGTSRPGLVQRRRLRRRERRTRSPARAGYISYPKDWLKGIFEARPLLADGPGLALAQLSLGFFLAPLAVARLGRARAAAASGPASTSRSRSGGP